MMTRRTTVRHAMQQCSGLVADHRRRGQGQAKVLSAPNPFVPDNALQALRRSRGGNSPRMRLRDVAVICVDIEGCTRRCEQLPPRAMNDVIETYFSTYLNAVRTFGGDVTELLGDGLLVVFERSSLQASVEAAFNAAEHIRTITAALNRRRARRHDPIALYIGLNAGQALTGLIRLRGSAVERWFYAASGPVTNIAAHLCALANGGQMLTTKAIADLVPDHSDFQSMGPQLLKNVAMPVEVVDCHLVQRHADLLDAGGIQR